MYNDGQGRLSKRLYHLSSTKLFSQMSYNNRGLLAELVHSENSYSYAYDALGNITEVAENDTLTEYRYDEYARLTDYIVGEDTTTYTYDDGNNLTGILNGNNSTSFSYQDDLLTAVTVTEGGQVVDNRILQYDAGGNLINDGQQQYTWAAGRHLAGISGSGLSASYRYNSSGLRTEKTVNGVKSKYYYLDDKVVAEEIGDTLIYYTYAGDTPVGMEIDGVQYYYLTNGQGDVTHVVDDAGNVVASYEYDPWGRIIASTGTETTGSPGYLNPYRYRGYRYDHESGLYYLQSRYYSPEWGRFISADDAAVLAFTQGELLSHNLFAYCDNDPVNKVDPSGYLAVGSIIGGIIGLGAGAIFLPMLANKWGLSGIKKVAFIGLGTAALTVLGGALGYYAGKALISLYAKGGQTAKTLNNAIARVISKYTGASIKVAKGNGYKLELKNYTVRIMTSGGGRTNYIRISHAKKGAMTIYGKFSNIRSLTHINLTVNNLYKLIKLMRKWS